MRAYVVAASERRAEIESICGADVTVLAASEFFAGCKPLPRRAPVVVLAPPEERRAWLRAGASEVIQELRALPDAVEDAIARSGSGEDALRESEARFRDLADNIAQRPTRPAGSTGTTGAGTSSPAPRPRRWRAGAGRRSITRVTDKFKKHIASGEPWEDTFPLRRKDGTYRWFLSRAFPLRAARGAIVSWFGTNTDITAQPDRRKDEFIAILAHELRNPLAPVRTAAEVLHRVGSADPRAERARAVIERQLGHMARLIDDLLDISRIARGKLALQLSRCDIAAIARETAEDYRATVEDAGLELSVEASEPVWALGDPVRIAQMIGNLLHNASRFTDRGGRVRVIVGAEAERARASVVDMGIGISPELLARLFDPFIQADQDLARTKGALGLGLALTRGLAQLHGGDVQVESEVGVGSRFTLRVPLAPEDVAERARGERAPSSRSLRILVVEDNQDAAETLGDLLELGGHRVKLAFDGAEALETAREFRPEVVISDIGLPGELDGYGVARALRLELDHGAFLVALSGYVNDEARRLAREAGFDEHLAKPPDIVRLERVISESQAGR